MTNAIVIAAAYAPPLPLFEVVEFATLLEVAAAFSEGSGDA